MKNNSYEIDQATWIMMCRTNSHVSLGERLEHMNCTQDPSNFYDSFDLVLVPVIEISFWRSEKEQWKHNRIVNFECQNSTMMFRMASVWNSTSIMDLQLSACFGFSFGTQNIKFDTDYVLHID